jgi:5-hydroxyisourate hydrolase-like protein (transthyretin family)
MASWTHDLNAAPANDNFSEATVLSGLPVSGTGTNLDATLEPDEPLPDVSGPSAGASVWFEWTPTSSGAVRVDTLGSDFDTVLVVWTGDELASLVEVTENDQFNGDQSAVFFDATAGQTYRIAVYGWDYEGSYDQGIIDLNITPDSGSRIMGTVAGPDGTTPLPGISVEALTFQSGYWQFASSTQTRGNGSYSLGGLAAGTYRVRFSDWDGNYVAECHQNASTVETATDIVVGSASTVSGINASLAAASRITGTVTGPDGSTPLAGIYVDAWAFRNGYWDFVFSTQTQEDGSYSLGGLAAGTYRVQFNDWSSGNYLGEYYQNAATVETATDIVVGSAATVSGINASLAAASRITGTVTGPDGSTPLAGITVEALTYGNGYWDFVFSTQTQEDGSYSLGGLAAGTYRVQFNDWSSGSYLGEYYQNAATVETATDIVVGTTATVSGINASLAAASRITGTVTGPDGSTPLAGITVQAYRASPYGIPWQPVYGLSAQTQVDGSYSLGGLAAGTYRVQFNDWSSGNYLGEYYHNAATVETATDIVVGVAATVSGINASLMPSAPVLPKITGFRKTGPNSYELDFVGAVGRRYQVKESTTLIGWSDVGASFVCGPGLTTIPVTSSEPRNFWRVVLVP